MENDYSAFLDEAKDVKGLERIAALAAQLKGADNAVAVAEENLKAAKEVRDKLSQSIIPEAMDEMGVTSVELSDGGKLAVQSKLRVSIPKDSMGPGLKWLMDNGHGAIVKSSLVVDLGKGADAEAQRLLQLLGEELTDATKAKTQTGVHPSTLSSWATEQLKEGIALPKELFSIFDQRTTKITHKKKS